MAAPGRDDRGNQQGGARGPWQGGRPEGQRDEDDVPRAAMRGGSVYEERQGYGQPRPGYSTPEQGVYEGYADSQSTGRRDYGGGSQGYPERGFGSGGYGQGGDQLGPAGGPPRYAGAGYGGGEPTYMGYGYQQEQQRAPSQRQDYGPGQGQQAYVSYGGASGYGRRSEHHYGEGPEPSSGAFGGAGLGGYSEGSADIGRGLASAFGYGEQAAYRQAGYGRQGQGETAEQRGGGFRGRGPKGYQRSDERINDEVCQCLCDDDYIDASDIEVTVAAGEVTLTGTVPDRQSRRRAEDLVEQISGVQHVQNNLRTNRPR